MANTCCEGVKSNDKGTGLAAETGRTQTERGQRPVLPTATETAEGVVTEIVSMLGWDRVRGDQKAEAVRRYILGQYPQLGRAPIRQEIATALAFESPEKVEAILERLDELDLLYVDPESREVRVAYPFSSVPTRHRVRFPDWADARPVYAQCAGDALGIPFMLRRDVFIESSCAQCDTTITIMVQNGAIVTAHPPTTLMWAGTTWAGHAATSVCPTINFFCSADHTLAWQRDQRNAAGHLLSLGEALYAGKRIFGDQLQEQTD